ATTVHPWYLITPLFLSVLAKDSRTLLWSMVVVFSYSHYQHGGFQEQWPWIIAEYALVAVWFFTPKTWRTKWIQPAT
ncbi:MAG: mannosyltransferase, partial [Bacteroidota bacterium]